ncbi:putative nuclease HARBI1 [Engystomops pustulosus]|uniref:putative nuclease HARBI1 n=1 Tax=Engystomops pustulosus TaxID=76066 RepID=UPI003AFA0788
MSNNNKNKEQQCRQTRQRMKRDRKFRIRTEFSTFDDTEYVQCCGLSKAATLELYSKIESKIESSTKRSIPGILKLVSVLHYLRTGELQHSVAARFGFTQPTFSRFRKQVIDSIVSICCDYIKFPCDAEEQNRYKEAFFHVAGIPNIIGIIDCTHVAVIPGINYWDHHFKNRKMFTSINVQMTCGPWLNIINVVARFPGSTHDQYILENSGLGKNFERGDYGDCILLGDYGYNLKKWLLTPYISPCNRSEENFNVAHCETRSVVERLFGVLKSRFRCLDQPERAFQFHPEFVYKTVLACSVLHNLAMQHHLSLEIADDLRDHIDYQGEESTSATTDGLQLRSQIAANLFQSESTSYIEVLATP